MMTTPMGITTPTMSTGLMVNPLDRVMSTHDIVHSSQREQVSLPKEILQPRVISPSSKIIGKGAAIFTDMMETILIAMTPDAQPSKELSPSDNQIKG